MVHVQDAHMINIYNLGTDLETNNNDDSVDNSNFQNTTNETDPHENLTNFLACIDDTQCQNSLDFTTQSMVTTQTPIVDLKLNSVESAVLSCSSRESSLSPQMILSNQHSQNCLIRTDDVS